MSLGYYCGADCQKACFPSHKIFHKAEGDKFGIAWTLSVALKAAEDVTALP